MSRCVRLTIVGAAAAVAGLVLHSVGSGELGHPPMGSWAALDEWYVERGPALAIVAAVRIGGMTLSVWLCAATALQLIVAWSRAARLASLADVLSPRFMRSVARGAAGLSLTAGLTLPALPHEAIDNPPGTAVMVPLDGGSTTGADPELPATPEHERPSTTTTSSPSTESHSPADRPAPPPSARREVIVGPGDSFWSIAAEQVGAGDVVGYWRALIEANRDRLVDPSNPDLLYAEQALVLP